MTVVPDFIASIAPSRTIICCSSIEIFGRDLLGGPGNGGVLAYDSFSKTPRANVRLKCVWQFANPEKIALLVASIIVESGYCFRTSVFGKTSRITSFSITIE